MKIKSIKKVILEEEKQYYDVVNAYPYNNFLVKTNSGYICSHNCFFDEISFLKNQDLDKQKKKAKDMIDTAIGGMMTRFIHNGKNPTLLVVASSKRSEQSFMEEYIRLLAKQKDKRTLIIDKPVWEVKPKGTYGDGIFYLGLGNKFLESIVIPDEDVDKLNDYILKGYTILEVPRFFRSKFIEDMDRTLCDIAGISSSSSNKYISGAVVKDCININRQNPFIKDILEVGNAKEDKLEYKDFFDINRLSKDMINKPLCIHLDMSISGDMTGIAGVWIKGKKPSKDDDQGKDLFFELAFSVSIKAPKGRQISFEKNRNFIRWLREQGFNIKEVTSDTFQSYDLQQQLSSEGFNCSILSVDRVEPNSRICKPYQFFKNVLYEQRIDMYESQTLIEEIVNLERDLNTGKVDHPTNFRKDVSDAVCGAIFTCSKYAEEFAYDYGESLDLVLNLIENKIPSTSTKEQVIVDFSEELSKLAIKPELGSAGVKKLTEDYFKDAPWLNPNNYDDFGIM